ncbi:hypothetical protein SY83_14280 [Paenibacillus swuensis]|uniref:Glycoside hydrolase family 38 central domain-containing protein n=1 Tax=Paenibacillus swuensis TaxID=1178515 RepID=A0A172TJK3_9BACL|nr:glycoside hydrolase family 38 C-terminal domain-containing protein [Paenibacillus swuensis]ANE47241.1 hypothetical protein SY83_14280 [Paenibacillus swuensis]
MIALKDLKKLKELHILNHTHWDREWYETFEEFRYKLRNGLRYVRDLLESGELDCFYLDGQTIVLEDYRVIVSEEEYERFVSLIRQGKVEVGPWYLLADEFLVSGESMLKNLEIGMGMARELGSTDPIGYLPDTFGHISQLPQLLRGHGIHTALIFRGAVSDRFENVWEGPDGSRVFAFVPPLFEGYYQPFLKHDTFVNETSVYLTGNAPYLTYGKALLMNGADHTFTAPDLKARIARLKEEWPDLTVTQTRMSDYVDSFRGQEPEALLLGEQRDPSKIFILPGVYSTRTYLKVQNQRCEDLAVGVMEPLNVWTRGSTDAAAFFTYVWKLILQNHPHDSICGCSIDEVHREMETRTQKALSAIHQYASDTLHSLYPFEYIDSSVENGFLYLVNNRPHAGYYPVKASIRIPAEQDTGAIRLWCGKEDVPFDVIQRSEGEQFFRHILSEPHYANHVTYDVVFTMPFDGVETKAVRIERVQSNTRVVGPGDEVHTVRIENDYYTVELCGHGLSVTDRESDTVYANQHLLTSSLDGGDTYNYSPPVQDRVSEAVVTGVSDVKHGSTFQSFTVHYAMTLPASLNDARTGPGEATTVNTFSTTVTLYRNDPVLRFHTQVRNTAKDQKLRVGFPVSLADVSWSDSPFDWIERKTLRDKVWDMPKNQEAVMNQYPTSSSVAAGGHQLIHRGLQEYEVDRFRDEDTVFLTLIRSVGWLSRRDLRTRGNGAGPGMETPEAQCIGDYAFDYGVVFGAHRHSLNHTSRLRQDVWVQQSYKQAGVGKLFALSSPSIAFSSFMLKAEDTFDIRMFNPALEPQSTEVVFGFTPEKIQQVDFTGKIIADLTAGPILILTLEPKQIMTIRITGKGWLEHNEGEWQ